MCAHAHNVPVCPCLCARACVPVHVLKKNPCLQEVDGLMLVHDLNNVKSCPTTLL